MVDPDWPVEGRRELRRERFAEPLMVAEVDRHQDQFRRRHRLSYRRNW
jgi:hypothetical protein